MDQKSTPTATNISQQMAVRIQRHQRRLYVVGLLALLGTIGFLFFQRHQRQQNEIAQAAMFRAVYYFEQETFDKALNGDGTCVGLLDIAQQYRFTQAANMANFYIGVSYMHQQDYKKAIQHLTKFKSKDLLAQARAWAVIGDALTAQQAYNKAAQYYIKAANYRPNKVFTPTYLTKAALAYEANKNPKAARGCYRRIVQDFQDATQYGEACKHVARLQEIGTKR